MDLQPSDSSRAEQWPRGGRWRLRVAACAAFVAGASGWAAIVLRAAPVVHAGGGVAVDSDGDGLHDELELVLGTNPNRFDSDGDGFCDGEEVARRSNPSRAQSVPSSATTSVAIDAYAKDGRVHALTTIYLPDGRLRGKSLAYGGEFSSALVALPLVSLRGGDLTRSFPAKNGQGRIVVLDPVVPESFVLGHGGFSMYVTLSSGGAYLAADALNLKVLDGEIFEEVVMNNAVPVMSATQQVGIGVGGIYRPLTAGGGSSNATALPGQICAQTSVVLGVVGALVTQEIVSAECVDGWDAHCTSGCAATVGSTVKSIDPAALIGG